MDQLTQAEYALADKAYDADQRVREKLKDKGCVAVIPPKKNRLDPSEYDKDLYKSRHLIETSLQNSSSIEPLRQGTTRLLTLS